MELGTTLIGIICVAICAMPFVLTNRSKKAIVKHQLIMLKDLATQHNNTITQNEINSFYAIGIDNTKKSVSFIFKGETEVSQLFVDLSKIKHCEIVNVIKAKHIDKLYLKLRPIDKTKEDVILEFFNAEVSYQLGEELQSIKKWNEIINNLLEE